MSKRKIIIICLILLLTTLFILPVKEYKGSIEHNTVYFNDGLQNESNRSTVYVHSVTDSRLDDTLRLNTSESIEHLSRTDTYQKQNNILVNAPTPSSAFTSIWNTTLTSEGSSSNQEVKLPLEEIGTYNFTVDWGDGTSNTITSWNQSEVTHSYVRKGIYTLSITGILEGWTFKNTGDLRKILEISKWGNLQLGNSGGYFWGSINLRLTAVDSLNLTNTNTLESAFKNSVSLVGNDFMMDWDASRITDMSEMFAGALNFNQDIGDWDVSRVTDMSRMFENAGLFDQPLNSWDVSSVTDMSGMFAGVTLSISNYDTLLQGWSELSLQRGVVFDAGNSLNSIISFDARQYIIDEFDWVISDSSNTQIEEIIESPTEEINETLDRLIIRGSLTLLLIAGL
ncbi:MAG: BspA family leucine-rich repeat surface protein, partial [Candidatus Heimdallarchaeota archaeon]